MPIAPQTLPWRDPLDAFAPFADEAHALLLLSAGQGRGRWSYICRAPDMVEDGDLNSLRRLLGDHRPNDPNGPPFQGGVVGLIAYEFADRLEPVSLPRDPDWPDLTLARYPAVLAFDHQTSTVHAVGPAAADWLGLHRGRPGPVNPVMDADPCAETYEAAVRDVRSRIVAGELYQANIARVWTGRLAAGTAPFDVMRRLVADSPAPYCAYWRLPGRAIVSHSPERFVAIAADGRTVETRPIKGTRPRGCTPALDTALKAELVASLKDRAENLMIVDLMRNDLARVCEPGTVATPEIFRVESFPAVHHLVSTVTGRLREHLDAADLLAATFPPGSITGAPKVQAMKVIAAHEGPRGPWCGSLFWAGFDGALDSSVLIRTAALVEDVHGWRFRAPAGAGIVADSDPLAERLETEAKISGLLHALRGEGETGPRASSPASSPPPPWPAEKGVGEDAHGPGERT